MNGSAPHLEDVLGTVDRGLWRRIAVMRWPTRGGFGHDHRWPVAIVGQLCRS